MAVELIDQLVREGLDLPREILVRSAVHRVSRSVRTIVDRRCLEMQLGLQLWALFLAHDVSPQGGARASLG